MYDCLHTGHSTIRVCRLASHSLVVEVVEVVVASNIHTDRQTARLAVQFQGYLDCRAGQV